MKQELLKQIMSGDKIPVERGCNNKDGCFCTGKCKEVIGYYINGKFVPDNSNKSDTTKYYDPLYNFRK